MELDQQQPERALELASEQLKVKHRLSQVRKQIEAHVIVQHHLYFRVKLLPEKISVHFIVLFIILTLTLILTKCIFTKKETLMGESNLVTNSLSLPASCSWILSISMGVVTTTWQVPAPHPASTSPHRGKCL